ncbi:hypothetical protein LOC68_17810 [Blastopirellula sp. JC732]|uniref:Uncharacterized protein n=1 Tax=Blastopirellula sediminis TaxID=2894196 RepID=A0A9X1SKY8_9BACT|nr:hypothetical protein [Blastopirellula sediminis]MCC9606448.1 hypothetical protein [Blastopirellula sediminis]MCC9630254.1 hypothetical protein [Blastopirellula sediminis]
MNQPSENPFASPRVDEFVEVLPDAEEGTNEQFQLRVGKIVGESPLSLPRVCLYCAADIVDDFSLRRVARYHRLRLSPGRQPILFQFYCSTCSACVAAAQAWRRRRSQALYFALACVLLAVGASFLGLYGNAEFPETAWLSLFSILGIALVAPFFRVWYCESQLPKFPELESYAENTMTVKGAGWKFIERFREGSPA